MRFLVVKKKTLTLWALLLAVAAAVGAVSSYGGINAAGVYLGYTSRKIPVYRVGTDEKRVAISFDAAWGADKTEALIETLKEHGAGATFFLVGFWARKYPALVQKIDAAGFEIGTHSNTHPNMPRLNEAQMDLEFKESVASIEELTKKTVRLFRAPFGDYSDKLLTCAEKNGLKTIQWDVDSLDWKDLTAGVMAERVLSRVKPGSIVLFHNDGKHTLEALPAILLGLKNKNYEVTNIGGLLPTGEYDIDHTGMTRSKN